jgi:hypothetical protein
MPYPGKRMAGAARYSGCGHVNLEIHPNEYWMDKECISYGYEKIMATLL